MLPPQPSPSPCRAASFVGRRTERGGTTWRLLLVVAVAVLAALAWRWRHREGVPSVAPRPPQSPAAQAQITQRLAADVEHLALTIGARHLGRPEALAATADWLVVSLLEAGWEVERQGYEVDGQPAQNLVAARPGALRPGEIVIVGAHYDTVRNSPGANDNGSGVAVLLALARARAQRAGERTLRLLFFTNEEPPWFQTDDMGSVVYAAECAARDESIVAVVSLDSVGYFTDEPDSQHLPGPVAFLFPEQGNFLAVAGNLESRALVARVAAALASVAGLAVESGSLPAALPGVGWSDHWSFWQHGYPGVVVTDTALYRDPAYHRWNDRPDRLDYERMQQIVLGMDLALDDLLRVAD